MPDELGGGVGDDAEAAGVGLAEVLPELMGGLDVVPQPARASLDHRVSAVGIGLGDDLGIRAIGGSTANPWQVVRVRGS